MVNQKNTVIIIAGPTAVGKTAVAIEIAKHFGTEIISSDSRQCYKELNIGVARPSVEELQEVKHHFIASHSIHENITAASFEKFSLAKTEEIFMKNRVVVIAGGTGLYIKAFCEGLDEIPEIPGAIRDEVINQYNVYGLPWLQEEVRKTDPLFSKVGEMQNPQRLIRALEVLRTTGKSIVSFRKKEKKKRSFEMIKIGLELPKETLHQNINERVDKMIESGLVEEAHSLVPYQHLNALQTVGYKELFCYFDGAYTLHDAAEAIKKNTRQYAKRQMTWFKNDATYKWFEGSEKKNIVEYLQLPV